MSSRPAVERLRIWIDTDPSIGLPFHDADDAFALTLAAASPELEIVGISVSYGNTSQQRAMRIAAAWAGEAGVDPRLLAEGATGPGWVAATGSVARLKQGAPLVYVALAPLTHLAGIFKDDPEVVAGIRRVVFVGGRSPGVRLRMGNRLPYEFHDANFEKDPVAVERVLRAGLPMELIPVELGPLYQLGPDEFEQMAGGGAAARWLAARGRSWLRGWRWGFGTEGAPCFDLPAVAALIIPEAFTWEERILSVQGGSPPQLIAAERGEGYRVRFCTGMDSEVRHQVVERIRAL